MSKLPSFQFYPGDWVQDTACLSLSSKGAWIDILCALWRAQNRGTLTCSIVQWARIIRADAEQARRVIDELVNTCVCDSVTLANGDITLISRRQVKEEKDRKMNAIRQERYRNNETVTLVSRKNNAYSSSSSSSSNKKKTKEKVELPESLEFVREDIERWLDYKRERNESYKPVGFGALIKKLLTFQSDKIKSAIDNSMAQNWAGIHIAEASGATKNAIKSHSGEAKPNLQQARIED